MIPAPNRPYLPAEGRFVPITPLDRDGVPKCPSPSVDVPALVEYQTPRTDRVINAVWERYTKSRYHGGWVQQIHDYFWPPGSAKQSPFASPKEEAHFKSLLQPGDIIFTHYDSIPFQNAPVKLFFATDWVHGGVYLGNGEMADSTDEANPGRPEQGGVAIFSFDEFVKGKDRLLLLRPQWDTPVDRKTFVEKMRAQQGTKFDYAFSLDGGRYYCTEGIYHALMAIPNPPQMNLIPFLWRKLVVSTSFFSSPDFEVVYATKSSTESTSN